MLSVYTLALLSQNCICNSFKHTVASVHTLWSHFLRNNYSIWIRQKYTTKITIHSEFASNSRFTLRICLDTDIVCVAETGETKNRTVTRKSETSVLLLWCCSSSPFILFSLFRHINASSALQEWPVKRVGIFDMTVQLSKKCVFISLPGVLRARSMAYYLWELTRLSQRPFNFGKQSAKSFFGVTISCLVAFSLISFTDQYFLAFNADCGFEKILKSQGDKSG